MTNLGLNFTSAISLLYKAFKTLIYLQVESKKTIYLKQVKKRKWNIFLCDKYIQATIHRSTSPSLDL